MKRLPIIIALLFLASCASAPPSKYAPRRGGEYVTASWYGSDFHGRPTSSGERYDMYGQTAAHKTMKFGTQLRVTNPDTGRSTDVIVNDRGPFIRGRDLDLSYGAAKKIGLEEKGVGRVKIEYLGRDMRYAKRMPFEPSAVPGLVTVQIGSFKEETNAARLKQGLDYTYKDVHITTATVNGEKFYRVRIGKFRNYDNAYALAEKLADEGYSTLITSRD